MKIRMKNQIQLDGQTELIDQMYDADWIQKGTYHYLSFVNEEGEKVILKFHESELVMTRFSTPKSVMRFVKEGEAPVGISTPMGIQQFKTSTSRYCADIENQQIQFDYQLTTLDGGQVFADYQMNIMWGESVPK